MTAARRLLGFLAQHRGRLSVAFGAMVVLALATGAYPILLDLLTTRLVAPAEPLNGRAWVEGLRILASLGVRVDGVRFSAFVFENLLAIFVGVVAVKAGAQAIRFYAMGSLALRVTRDVRAELFACIVHQDAAFFGPRASGDLVSRLINDVRHVERTATYALPVLIGDVLRVLVLGGVCLVEYTRLSLVSCVVLPLAVVPIVCFGRLLKRFGRQAQEAVSGITRRVTETLGGIRAAMVYGREQREIGRFRRAQDAYVNAGMKSVRVRAIQTPAMELVGVVAVVVTLQFALSVGSDRGVRPGEVIGFLLALVLLYEPIKAIGRLSGIVMPGLVAAERVFEIADRAPSVIDAPDATELVRPVCEVAFEQVGFRYREKDAWALDGVDLTLRRGRTVALVGPSGGGKSTLAALVPRLFDATRGAVTVDGLDVKQVQLASWREQVALVEQDAYLFDDSFAENIAYAKVGATRPEIEAAARRAQADGFIRARPGGYDAPVGERGCHLSSGQRQRIAIARAFLRDAPVVILDEVTSALDRESEQAVRVAVSELLRDRAALVIAHRLESIRESDEIVVLAGGRVLERGSHQELMRAGGWYARWAAEGGPA